MAFAPFQNPIDPYDVNVDGERTAMDVLIVINNLNDNASDRILGEDVSAPAHFVDVSGDGHASAVDALMLINLFNEREQAEVQSVTEPALDLRRLDAADFGNIDPAVLQLMAEAESQAEAAPPGNIFAIATSAFRELASTNLTVHRDITDEVVDAVRDDGPLLRLLRETVRDQFRNATDRFVQTRDAAQFGQHVRQINEGARHVITEVTQDNLFLFRSLNDLRRDVVRNQVDRIRDIANTITDNVRQNVVERDRVTDARAQAVTDIADELGFNAQSIADFQQRIDAINGQRQQNNQSLHDQIVNLGDIGGVSSADLFGTISTVETFPSGCQSTAMTSIEVFGLTINGNSLSASARTNDFGVVDEDCVEVTSLQSTSGQIVGQRDPVTGIWSGTITFQLPAFNVPGFPPQNAFSSTFQWRASGSGTQLVGPQGIGGDVLSNGQVIGQFQLMAGT